MAADTKMVDVATVEVVLVKVLPSSKAFVAPYGFAGVKADGYMALGNASWFAIDVLEIERFVDQYATDGWFPGYIRLEWT